jgi:uncharacterized protein YkwD
MAIATRSKRSTPSTKKRSGKHHRHSKVYLKAYWPYLPMLLIVGIGIAINSLWSAGSVLGSSSNFSSNALLSQTNQARTAASEPALTLDPQLTAAAEAKANDMVSRNYWAHNTPDGKTPWTFIVAAGYQYQAAGENLAYGFDNASDTVTGWMNSPEHRANILNASYQNVGFGVASSPNYQGKGPETVVVAEYGQPVTAVANITFTVPNPVGAAGAQDTNINNKELSAQPVSRIQLLTGGKATWATMVASAIAGAALAIFLIRHWFHLKRLISRSELFIVHHPWLDIAATAIFTTGFILTRTSGLIR